MSKLEEKGGGGRTVKKKGEEGWREGVRERGIYRKWEDVGCVGVERL